MIALLLHAGHHLEAGTVLSWWSWEPFTIVLLALSGALYAAGLARLWRRAGVGQGIRRWEALCFAAGWLALIVALLSPVDALGGILFSAHMVQHELLILVAAPLMVLGRPLAPFLWALPPAGRDVAAEWTRNPAFAATWRRLTAPFAVFVIHGLALWIWHLPSLYQATLDDEFIHALQHLSFFLSSALFWWSLIHGRFGRLGYGAAVVYVFLTSLHSGVLGALLTFAPRLWYPIYEARTSRWGLSPLEDQQLAGLLMWIPAGVVFIVLGLGLFAAWLREAERRVARTQSEMMLRAIEPKEKQA
ncbi:MAG TPA: cytochrome c oxidase assembly protein [Thermoanaerobaculia bacterium]|jgi:cytochrome c oxidase assembly factor CtaG|nr:cytochrome c oxidase assembly protein [Thermoanaerobaculia bacterium]